VIVQFWRCARSRAHTISCICGSQLQRGGDRNLDGPGDNLYRLTFIAERPHKLLVEFDDQILVVLTEPQRVVQSAQVVLINSSRRALD